MGCLNNFVRAQKLIDSGELEVCDIIEFNRIKYSHFGFYIGDGICINVTGPDSGAGSSSSSSSSKKFAKGQKEAERLVDIAGYDDRFNTVRVNNCVLIASTLLLDKRPINDALERALRGLKLDSDGEVVLNDPIPYNYNLVKNNCEYFATRCRYDTEEGFSIQTSNPTMNSTLGTVERVTSAVRHDLGEIIMDEDANPLHRVAAAGGYAAHTAIGWTAYGLKTGTDVVAGVTESALNFFFK